MLPEGALGGSIELDLLFDGDGDGIIAGDLIAAGIVGIPRDRVDTEGVLSRAGQEFSRDRDIFHDSIKCGGGCDSPGSKSGIIRKVLDENVAETGIVIAGGAVKGNIEIEFALVLRSPSDPDGIIGRCSGSDRAVGEVFGGILDDGGEISEGVDAGVLGEDRGRKDQSKKRRNE